MDEIRKVSAEEEGISRRRADGDFRYAWPDGSAVDDDDTLGRIRELAIPPAWTDVWICKDRTGHIQATGRDAADRKQYKYSGPFVLQQQMEKFSRLHSFALHLPDARQEIASMLGMRSRGFCKTRVLAVAVALLDETAIRIGNRSYASRYGTIGLTTLRRKHVEVDDDTLLLSFRGKSGVDRCVQIDDEELSRLIQEMSELPGYEVFRYQTAAGKFESLDSGEVNEFIRDLLGEDHSAKTFRTWFGTSIATGLGSSIDCPADSRKSRLSQVIERVAEALGNTPAVARAYYVHPQICKMIESGEIEVGQSPATLFSQAQLEFLEDFEATAACAIASAD